MQTNREDVGKRYREIRIPTPKSVDWAEKASSAFRRYFQGLADAKLEFANSTATDGYNYIASVSAFDTGDGVYE